MREGRQQLFLLRDLPDQRPPLRNFLPDLRAELLERGLGRIGASVAHGLLHLRIVGQLDQELRELADDGLRSLRRSHDGVPRLHNEIGKNYLMNRRKIGQVGAAIERSDGEAANRAGLGRTMPAMQASWRSTRADAVQ
jgi:hypothetical protein